MRTSPKNNFPIIINVYELTCLPFLADTLRSKREWLYGELMRIWRTTGLVIDGVLQRGEVGVGSIRLVRAPHLTTESFLAISKD